MRWYVMRGTRRGTGARWDRVRGPFASRAAAERAMGWLEESSRDARPLRVMAA